MTDYNPRKDLIVHCAIRWHEALRRLADPKQDFREASEDLGTAEDDLERAIVAYKVWVEPHGEELDKAVSGFSYKPDALKPETT